MPIIRVRDNENNRWKSNVKKQRKEQGGGGGGAESIVKGWELPDLVVRFS